MLLAFPFRQIQVQIPNPYIPDHSCPPISLVSPEKLVGCRGGSRYVEGHWGFPYLHFSNFKCSVCIVNLHIFIFYISNFQTSKLSFYQIQLSNLQPFDLSSTFQISKFKVLFFKFQIVKIRNSKVENQKFENWNLKR